MCKVRTWDGGGQGGGVREPPNAKEDKDVWN